jgi:phosphoribosylglycinamide formyltransferase-1
MAKKRVAILISGRGSNMQALINACAEAGFPAEVKLVISNKAEAPGLEFAKKHNIKTDVISHKTFTDRADYDAELHRTLVTNQIEIVCLAGFMRLLSAEFTEVWRDKVINIHPSLLPAFKGVDTHKRALETGVKFSGCTVHYVRPAMDEGPIILQAACPVLPDDTEEKLAARVLELEHKAYPIALKLVASGAAKVVDGVVNIKGAKAPSANMLNPVLT